jgi:hypothetical protein
MTEKRLLVYHPGDKRYRSSDGWTMTRELGETPNGNPIARRWVLRDETGKFLDVDQYRHDLSDRFGVELQGHESD